MTANRRPGPSGRGTILLLAAVAALGSLATQLLVPALPAIARDLHAGVADTQLVIAVFLVGLGSGQLLTGPLADRIGRKPVLLGGLLLYCAGSLLAAFAPSLPLLLVARGAQALGASAGVVTARVLVGDLFPPEETAARQATLMGVVLVSPALAPVIGGQLTEWAGWRIVFAMLAVCGIAGAVLVATVLPLSARAQPTGADDAPGLVSAYRGLFRNRGFLAATVAIAGNSAALYMFLGTVPFLLSHVHGLSPREVGQCLMIVALASIGGTFLVGRVDRHGHALIAGTTTAAAGALAMLGLALCGVSSIAAVIGPLTLLGFGAGMTGPAGITRVIRAEPRFSATAASLAGATQMLTSALGASLLGHFAPVDATRLAWGLTPAALIAVLAATLSKNRANKSM